MRNLGLDTGKANSGVAIIDITDEDISVVHASTRIFKESVKKDNETRRSSRGSRRIVRRKKYRVDRKLRKLLNKYGIGLTNDFSDIIKNPYELRVEGLSRRLSEKELIYVLTNYLKHRGVDYLDEVDSEDIAKIKNITDDKYVCEYMLEQLNEYNRKIISGEKITKDDQIGLLNGLTTYKRKDIVIEINALLDKQIELNSSIDENFKFAYLKVFSEKRKYYQGPGDEFNRTDYGIYRTEKDENGEYITWDNLFENLVGSCSVFPEEKRAPRLSYTAQEFNFLNDLNNLRIADRKITFEEKRELLNLILASKTISLKVIAKVCNVNADEISGYSKDSSGNMKLEKFQYYTKVRKKLNSKDISKEDFNSIADIMSLEGPKEYKVNKLKKALPKYSESECEEIFSVVSTLSSKEKGWHSLSYKAMETIMDDLWHEPKNQMQIFAERKLNTKILELYSGKNKIPMDEIAEGVINPIVVRSFRQTCKIIDAAIKKYGPIDKIVVEMARDLHTDAKQIEKEQKANAEKKKKATEEILSYAKTIGLNVTERDITANGVLRYLLWEDQKGTCMYSLKPIAKDVLIENILGMNSTLEIDHIFPISISYDDSKQNKVLVYRTENQLKGRRTPYQYFSSIGAYDEFEKFVKSLKSISDKKKDYLLMKENPYKYEVRMGFINRNLNDTRYASRLLLNTLQNYIKANGLDTKVAVVRGGFTAITRNKLRIKKDRQNYNNHAIDAIVIAAATECSGVKGNLLAQSVLYNAVEISEDVIKSVDVTGSDVIESEKDGYEKALAALRYSKMDRLAIAIYNADYKYSHKVDKKVNSAITNKVTIWGTREVNGTTKIVNKYKDIYSNEGEGLATKLRSDKTKDCENLLIYENDRKTFEILKNIACNMYPEAKNPFAAYRDEHGYVRKYSKKGNGPVVKDIKYLSETVDRCVDISHKYNHEKGSKKAVMVGLAPYRVDVYISDGKYYIVDIPYNMFKFKKGKYILNLEEYDIYKKSKKIPDNATFKFSIYKGDKIHLIRSVEGKKDYVNDNFIFLSVRSAKNNNLEFEYVEKTRGRDKSGALERVCFAINSGTTLLEKYYVDMLGNTYKAKNEKFQTEFKL